MVKRKIFSEKIMNKVGKREKEIKEKLNNIKNYNNKNIQCYNSLRFFNEVLNSENLKDADFRFKIVILDDGLIMVEGFSKVISLSSTNIALKLETKKRISIDGENFVITTLGKSELVARGLIGGIKFD